MGTFHHSYYWRYRCPANGMLTRLPLRISDEERDKLIEIGEHLLMRCRFCAGQHAIFLERSEFAD